MNTRAKSFERRTRTANLETWTAIAGLLIGVGALTACGPVADAMDAGGLPGSDVSTPPPDGSAFADAGTTPASGDAAVLPPHPNATCTTGAQCASGFCVDGVCCDRACDGSCESCALTGKVGTCSPIKNAGDDTCDGDAMCDGSGACRKRLGTACTVAGECASGSCVDGVCCASGACATCQSCALPGSEGTCAPMPRFTDDGGGADARCAGVRTCDGVGGCRAKNGTKCDGDADCTSLHCVDGVCCNQACDGTCYSCNLAGSAGVCKPIDGGEDAFADVICGGTWICTAPAGATPACKIREGGPCTTNADCASGSCLTSFRDEDGDGFGGAKVSRCERAPAAGYVLSGGDCCDSDRRTYPGVTTSSSFANACGSFDLNCDGRVEPVDIGYKVCGCPPGVNIPYPGVCTSCR